MDWIKNTMPKLNRPRLIAVITVICCAVLLLTLKSGLISKAQQKPVAAPLAPAAVNIVANLTDNVSTAQNPGGTLTYTATIQNTGTTDATGLVYNNQINAATTLVASSVNVQPIATNDSYNAAGNVTMVIPDGATDLTSNDTDADGNTISITTGTFATTQGGSITIAANGSFSYQPPRGFGGVGATDSYTYTINDNSGATNATATGTINFTVSTPIWFINPAAGAGGNGTFASPYNSLTTFSAANAANGATDPADGDFIFLYSGTHTGGLTLRANQKVLGQSATISILAFTGIATPSGTNQLPGTGGAATTIANGAGNGITLNSGNTINGFALGNSSGSAISGTSFGTLTFDNVSINSTGQALSLTTGTLAGTGFTTITSSGGTNNISLTAVAGTLPSVGGALSGASGTAFLVSGGTAAITYTGTISKTSTGQIVNIGTHATGNITLSGNLTCNNGCTGINASSNTSGTINFSGVTKTVNTGATAAVTLATNTGATLNFSNGGLDIDTTSGNGFSATGGGTINISTGANPNTIDTTTGAALTVQNTTIGGSGLTFRSINSNGGTNNGITLDNTGAGNFTVTGTGSAGTGGTIQNKNGTDGQASTNGTGIYLNSVAGAVSLSYMSIQGCQNYGIRGFTVSGGMTIDNTNIGTVTKNGTTYLVDAEPVTNLAGEASLRFTNLTGTVNFSNDSFDRGFGRTVHIHNSAVGSTLTLNITNSTLRQSLNNTNGGDTGGNSTDALTIQAINNATVNLNITGSHFTAYRQFGILTDMRDTATLIAEVANSDFSNDNTGNVGASCSINFGGGGGTATDVLIKYYVHDSTFRHGSVATGTPNNGGAHIVSGGVSGGVKADGRIINNTFGVSGVVGSGAGGAADVLRLFASGNNAATTRVTGSTHTRYLVQNNIIQRYGEVGIQFNARQGNSIIDATVIGNTIREPGTAALGAFGAIWVNSGALAADTNQVNITIGSATVAADKNTMQNSDPSNATDVFLDDKTCAGCASSINLYQNGSDAAGATTEAKARDVLVDDNNPTLDLLTGFTNNSTIGFIAGLPPQPSFAQMTNEEGFVNINDDSDNALNFSKISFQTPLEMLAAEPFINTSVTAATVSFGENIFSPEFKHNAADLSATVSAIPDKLALPSMTTPSASANLADVSDKGSLTVAVTDSSNDFSIGRFFAVIWNALPAVDRLFIPTVEAQNRKDKSGESKPSALLTGETVNKTIGTLPVGKTVTIVYQVKISDPACTTSFSTQGAVSGTNFSTLNTNDPDTVAAGDATTTTVNKATATNSLSLAATSTAGQPVTLTATVAAQGTDTGCSPSGTVQFKAGATNIGSPVTISGGTAVLNTAALPLGTSTVTAAYNGDASFNAVTSNGQSHTVNKASTVYVDDSFVGSADAQDLGGGKIFDRNAFSNIAGGLTNVAASGTVNIADGSYNETVTLNQDATVALSGNVTLTGGLAISQGTLTSPSGTFSLGGNFTRNGGTFNANGGTVVFNGSSAQNIGGTSASTFNNLTLANASGVNLGANAAVNGTLLINANVLFNLGSFDITTVGTLTNNGTIRKTQAVAGTGAKTFGLAGRFSGADLTIDVVTQGTLSSLQVDRIDSNHPNAAAPEQTGRYWIITPTGSGYSVNLTLPRDNAGAPSVCRYTGAGTTWDCDTISSTANSVTRNNVTTLSAPWAVGNNAVINNPADLTVTKSHSGNFTQGDVGKTYTITVTNSGTGAPTFGTVTATDTLPAGLTATAISGAGWNCVLGTLTCTRSDALAAGSSYPAITLTVNVANNAPASVTNTATVSGGSETNTANDTANDPTTVNAVANYTVSGQVTNGGAGLQGVTITLSGASSSSATTDAAGNYSFSNLTGGGNYTVTPSLNGYTFNPTSTPVNNLTSNQTAINFATSTASYEADTAPRPSGDGDGTVNGGDITVIRKFVAGIEAPPTAANGSEFQRVDSAPLYDANNLLVKGDGAINGGDITQVRRYAAGLDAVQPAGGPAAPVPPPMPINGLLKSFDSLPMAPNQVAVARDVRPVKANLVGNVLTVAVNLNTDPADTAANTVDFTLLYDTTVLSNPTNIRTGINAPAATTITPNTSQTGKVGIVLDLPVTGATTTFPTGDAQLVLIDFTVVAMPPATTVLSFGDTPVQRFVGDINGNRLTTTFSSGSVALLAPTAASVAVSGQVINEKGRGINRAVVTLTDQTGNVRSAITDPFGYYRFDDIEAGQVVVLTVKAKRYEFAQPTIVLNVSEDLSEVNFTAVTSPRYY